MTDEELQDRVLQYLEEGLTRLVTADGARANLEAFLRGEAGFIVSRAPRPW